MIYVIIINYLFHQMVLHYIQIIHFILKHFILIILIHYFIIFIHHLYQLYSKILNLGYSWLNYFNHSFPFLKIWLFLYYIHFNFYLEEEKYIFRNFDIFNDYHHLSLIFINIITLKCFYEFHQMILCSLFDHINY